MIVILKLENNVVKWDKFGMNKDDLLNKIKLINLDMSYSNILDMIEEWDEEMGTFHLEHGFVIISD